MIYVYYDKKSLKTVAIVSGQKVKPMPLDGKIWSNGKGYPEENIAVWTVEGNADFYHRAHTYMYIVEQDGKPIGVRGPTVTERKSIDDLLYIIRAENTIVQLRAKPERTEEEERKMRSMQDYINRKRKLG